MYLRENFIITRGNSLEESHDQLKELCRETNFRLNLRTHAKLDIDNCITKCIQPLRDLI